MTQILPITVSELRHTYPYGAQDLVMTRADAPAMSAAITAAFQEHPQCRRIVVAVPEGDLVAIAACEDAGLRYVVDVRQRDGGEYSLMVAEPDWVISQSTDIKDLKLQ